MSISEIPPLNVGLRKSGSESNSTNSSDFSMSSRNSALNGDGEGVRLKRNITLLNGCTIIVGVIVGSGIFVSSQVMLNSSGSPIVSIAVWIACGIYAIFGALCYAELGTMIPKSGGDYTYISKAFGPFAGYIFLWISLTIINPACTSVTALAFAKYVLKPFFMYCEAPEEAVTLLAACVILIIGFVNCYRVSWVTGTQNVSTVAKVGALTLIIISGIYVYFSQKEKNNFSWTSLKDGIEDTKPFSVATAFYSGVFTFNGWAYLNLVTEEVKEPSKNLPRAILISLPLVTLIYVLVNCAYFVVLDVATVHQSQAIAVDFAYELFGFPALIVIPLFVAISCIGGLNGTIFTYSRMFFAGAREGQLPEMISMLNLHFVTPMVSVILLSSLTLLMTCIWSIDSLIAYMAFSQVLIYTTVVAALLKLRFSEPNTPRPLRVPLFVPIMFILVSSGVLVMSFMPDVNSTISWTLYVNQKSSTIKALIVIFCGMPMYLLFVKNQMLPRPVYKMWISVTHAIQKLFFSVGSDESYAK